MLANFISKLMSGDLRSVVALVLILLILVLLSRQFKGLTRNHRAISSLLGFACIGLVVYGLAFAPERTGEVFSDVVDWIAGRIERLTGG